MHHLLEMRLISAGLKHMLDDPDYKFPDRTLLINMAWGDRVIDLLIAWEKL